MNFQILKANQKEATISLIIGTIGALFLFLWMDNGRFFNTGIGQFVYRSFFSIFGLNITVILFDFSFIWIFFLSIWGFVLGRKGLKSSKKILAVLGLIVCILDLIISLFCGYTALILSAFM